MTKEIKTAPDAQGIFLEHLKRTRQPVTIFLTNGIKLQGRLTWSDAACVALSRDGVTQLVYKHAISTVMPTEMFQMADLLGIENDGNS